MHTHDEWKKLITEKLDKGEAIPQIVKRCPRCQELSLVYDKENSKIKCNKCGFEENLPKME